MGIESLLVNLKGKKVILDIDQKGLTIFPSDKDEVMTIHEIHYVSAIAFMHIGAHLKKVIYERRDVVLSAHNFYKEFHKSKEYFRSMEDMTLSEFNIEMRKYDGRGK